MVWYHSNSKKKFLEVIHHFYFIQERNIMDFYPWNVDTSSCYMTIFSSFGATHQSTSAFFSHSCMYSPESNSINITDLYYLFEEIFDRVHKKEQSSLPHSFRMISVHHGRERKATWVGMWSCLLMQLTADGIRKQRAQVGRTFKGLNLVIHWH